MTSVTSQQNVSKFIIIYLLSLSLFRVLCHEICLLFWANNTNVLFNHQVLHNDVLAHKTTVEAVNKAGRDLMESSAGEEACGLQSKLENLNQRWTSILEKTEQRRQLLDIALLQVLLSRFYAYEFGPWDNEISSVSNLEESRVTETHPFVLAKFCLLRCSHTTSA